MMMMLISTVTLAVTFVCLTATSETDAFGVYRDCSVRGVCGADPFGSHNSCQNCQLLKLSVKIVDCAPKCPPTLSQDACGDCLRENNELQALAEALRDHGYDGYSIVKGVYGTYQDAAVKILRRLFQTFRCVAGSMLVKTPGGGPPKTVESLHPGDVVMGVNGTDMEKKECVVMAVVKATEEKTPMVEGFTQGHYILNEDTAMMDPYLSTTNATTATMETAYNVILDDCDAVTNTDEVSFSPLSMDFCPATLSWTDYITILSSIRRIVQQTGSFWFDMSSFSDNATAFEPSWKAQLPAICEYMLLCASTGNCHNFEAVATAFTETYLRKDLEEKVMVRLPHVGAFNETEGTFSSIVCYGPLTTTTNNSAERDNFTLITIMVVVGVLIVLLAIMLVRRQNQAKSQVIVAAAAAKGEQQLPTTHRDLKGQSAWTERDL